MDLEHRGITSLTLPTEILAHIVSFVTPLRRRIQLRHVSRRLWSACETPSLWREFVWPYYYPGDECCVNSVLRSCGQHVKQLSFPHHVITTSKLIETLSYCCNAVELSLPTTKLEPEQLGEIFVCMEHLQSLDIQWENDIRKMLEIVQHARVNLKELTIRQMWVTYDVFDDAEIEQWLNYWIVKGYVPPSLNCVIGYIDNALEDMLLRKSYESMYHSQTCACGLLKFFTSHKGPMDLVLVIPALQIEFGKTATLPLVNADICGFTESDSLLLTNTTHCNEVIYKASLRKTPLSVHKNCTFDTFKSLSEFHALFCDVHSDQLKRLAVVCPNLKRLNLEQCGDCLTSLQGLRSIANYCHNLQGLNLMRISANFVENHIQLWEILSDMELTHLAVDLCILLPSVEDDKIKLIGLFQKCKSLQALESLISCGRCTSTFVSSSLSILSHFSALVHFQYNEFCYHYCPTALHDIISSCNQLKYLIFTEESMHRHYVTPSPVYTLEQLFIDSTYLDLPNDFMDSTSAHGRLVHVVLYVRSVTTEGIMVLVTNSPNLLTFNAFLDDDVFELLDQDLEANLKAKLSDRNLFKYGSYLVEKASSDMVLKHKCEQHADLISFWR